MRVMVTGHLGYIGTVMVPRLLEQGYEVVGLDSDLFKECIFYDYLADVPSTRKDIRDIGRSDLRGIDAVIHLAALSNDPLSDLNPEMTYEINHRASVGLARLAKEVGVRRFLFSSSCSVYGESSSGLLNEETKPNPITAYACSKLLAEKGISKLADSGFNPTFLRSATAYGVSPKLRFDLVLNNLVASAYTSGVVLLKSDGLAWRPLVHIEDITQAFLAVLEAPLDLVHNEIFNVGLTDENYQIRTLANIVRETVPNSRVEFEKGFGPDKRSYQVDFRKLPHRLIKYEGKWNVRLGARQLYEAYKKVGLEGKEFEGPRSRRVDHLKQLVESNKVDATLRWKRTSLSMI